MNAQTYQQSISALRFHPGLIRQLTLLSRILFSWYQRAQSRVALSKLDQRLLDDIGVSSKAAEIEIHKPFWKD